MWSVCVAGTFKHRFNDYVLDVALPESAYTRMDYLSRLRKSD